MRFETLSRIGPWQIDALPGTATDLVIAFASIGHDATRPPSPEFVRSATAGNRPALFVMDTARSFASAPGLPEALIQALEALRARQSITRTLAIGSSLGAFTALTAAETLRFDAILAISPQHQPAAPWEIRWRDWTATLPVDLTAPLPEGPSITLMHGMQDDAPHALAFPMRPNVDHILFADQSHSTLAPHLKARGLIEGMIAAALSRDRRRLLRMLSGAGGERRQLPR